MRFIRATDRQIQAIKNMCLRRSNLEYVSNSLKRMSNDILYQLSMEEAKDIISALVRRG